MKKYLLLLVLTCVPAFMGSTMISCAFETELPGYKFTNFKDTPAWELAQAVRDNNGEKVREIIKSSNHANYKDPKYQMTLLILAIANKKDKAFLALLEGGADSNMICGTKGDVTPLLTAIDFEEDCNQFYLENLVKYKANVNLKVKYLENGYTKEIVPLLQVIDATDKEGNECVQMLKLFAEYGADLNICINNSPSNRCEGVIEQCLMGRSIENLKYLIVDKKIPIPDTVSVYGEIDPATMKVFTLREKLNSEEYVYEDTPQVKKAKKEILRYLDSIGK